MIIVGNSTKEPGRQAGYDDMMMITHNGHHNNCREPGSLKKDSECRPAGRVLIGKYSWEQHLQRSEGSRTGQREKLSCGTPAKDDHASPITVSKTGESYRAVSSPSELSPWTQGGRVSVALSPTVIRQGLPQQGAETLSKAAASLDSYYWGGDTAMSHQ